MNKQPKYIPNGHQTPIVPLFWMNEQSGQLKEIVLQFLQHKPIDEQGFEILKEYFTYWVQCPGFVMPEYLGNSLNEATTIEELHIINKELIEIGLDIF